LTLQAAEKKINTIKNYSDEERAQDIGTLAKVITISFPIDPKQNDLRDAILLYYQLKFYESLPVVKQNQHLLNEVQSLVKEIYKRAKQAIDNYAQSEKIPL
jgi:hypothetical protein